MNSRAYRATALLCLLSVVLTAALVEAQNPYPTGIRTEVSKDGVPSCYDDATGKLLGSKRLRSPVLISSDGRFRAYTENDGIAFEQTYPGDVPPWYECANTGRLFVAGPNSGGFRLVYINVPEPYDLMKSVSLIDWSRDSRYLLFETCESTYGSDFGGCGAQLFAVRYNVFWPEDFTYRALQDHLEKNCSTRIKALGFRGDDRIVLKVSPYYDEEGSIEKESCVQKQGLWLMDPLKQTLLQLPDNYHVQHYGRWAEGSPTPVAK